MYTVYLPYISPISRPYLPRLQRRLLLPLDVHRVSPPYLAHISPGFSGVSYFHSMYTAAWAVITVFPALSLSFDKALGVGLGLGLGLGFG